MKGKNKHNIHKPGEINFKNYSKKKEKAQIILEIEKKT